MFSVARISLNDNLKAILFKWNPFTEAALQMCFQEKVFWKYAVNLQQNTHAEVRCVFSCKFSAYFQNTFS